MENSEKLLILSPRQREVYELRTQGFSFREIAEKLDCHYATAREIYARAERRFREYERYHDTLAGNNIPVEFSLTFGELRLIYEGLILLRRFYMGKGCRGGCKDWMGNVPYEYQIIPVLMERAEDILKNGPPEK